MIHVYDYKESGLLVVNVPLADMTAFKEMVQRATNLWPDAPPQIKHFADIVTNGKPMQDYFSRPDFKPSDVSRFIPLIPDKT